MKSTQLTLALILISVAMVYAQEFSMEFGEVSKKELEMTTYSKDTDAGALVIHDVGTSVFRKIHDQYHIVMERKTRIKILSETGLDYAEIRIPYYFDKKGDITDQIKYIEAYTYNMEDGRILKTKLSSEMVFEETINQFWKLKKFALPDIKPGSVIEYKYTLITPRISEFPDWEFQWPIPVIYSEYTTAMIPFYEYVFILQGINKFDVQERYEKDMGKTFSFASTFSDNSFKDAFYKFGMKHVPAFRNEKYITSVEDYIIKLDLQLARVHTPTGSTIRYMTSWDEMIKRILKESDTGKFLKKAEKLAKKNVDFSSIENLSDNEKFEWVMDYVKDNFQWNGITDKTPHQSAKDFYKTRSGNSTSVNLFAVGMLRKAGMDAYPVLFSTRGNGKIKSDYPFTHFFNSNMILAQKDNGQSLLSDATEYYLANNRIPPRNINDRGLVLKTVKNPEDVEWVLLKGNVPGEIKMHMDVLLNEKSGEITTRVDLMASEYEANNYRKIINDPEKDILDRLEIGDLSVIENSLQIGKENDRNSPLTIKYNAKGMMQQIAGKIYVDPFFGNVLTDNPLKERKRNYPVDFTYPQIKRFKTNIEIPAGYTLEYTPESKNIENERFSLNYQVLKGEQQVMVIFDYYIKQAVFNPNEYDAIKYYMNEIVKMGNEKIVLIKSDEPGHDNNIDTHEDDYSSQNE